MIFELFVRLLTNSRTSFNLSVIIPINIVITRIRHLPHASSVLHIMVHQLTLHAYINPYRMNLRLSDLTVLHSTVHQLTLHEYINPYRMSKPRCSASLCIPEDIICRF